MTRIFSLLLLAILLPAFAMAQQNEANLAQQYFINGEYEKSAALYQKLADRSPHNYYYFSRYINSLLQLEDYTTAEKSIKKRMKSYPKQGQLYVEYGNLLEKQFRSAEADEEFKKAIKLLPADRNKITQLANSFRNLAKYDLAIETYDKGSKVLKEKFIFSYQIGDLYRRKGDVPNMIKNYLDDLSINTRRMTTIQTYFQRYLTDEDFDVLKQQLYDRIQTDANSVVYPELLTWLFIQRKDFRNAFRQVKALDRRLQENGARVFKFAGDSEKEGDYDTAINAYNYIIDDKGPTCTYYLEAKRKLLSTKKIKLVEGFTYTNDDLSVLQGEYEAFLTEFGQNKSSAGIIRELAQLHAFYLNDLDKAVTLLEKMIALPGVHRYIRAESKLDLGDYYLMKDEIWEATLLYSQVDKDFKDDMLGEEARYRNARLSYYHGDFEWAQAQLSVLKASTSELISNDAIDLSVFIMDHWGLDTSATAMEMFSEADLLNFQNRFDESFIKLDSITVIFPDHQLEDDIFYVKSQMLYKLRRFDESAEMLQLIIDNHSDGIRADNALFDLAKLNENQLDQPTKAKELYGRILKEHSGSTLTVEARKRFRILRGDDVQ
ncbi:MAG: tetratricopeptide repeat protein [Bacteroidota bacterium]